MFDYTEILKARKNAGLSWQSYVNIHDTYPQQILQLLRQSVFLPKDDYKLITAYIMLPSVICQTLPYLFLFGGTGSGKSLLTKFICKVRGTPITASSDTYASIRNELEARRWAYTPIDSNDDSKKAKKRKIERNILLLIDDIDPRNFTDYPDLYRLLKSGYDKDSSVIQISGDRNGKNISFDCFCPKIFSSTFSFHTALEFKELARRLIVIPFQRIERLSKQRKIDLDIEDDNWQSKLIDLNAINWNDINEQYEQFWDYEQVSTFFLFRDTLLNSQLPITSENKALSLDLLATGLSIGIWEDEYEAVTTLKEYWHWLDQHRQKNQSIRELIKQFMEDQRGKHLKENTAFKVSATTLHHIIDGFYQKNWILEMPSPRELKAIMGDLGYRLNQGLWLQSEI